MSGAIPGVGAMRALNPRHGTHLPTASTPSRHAPSVRRTGTLDVLRPDGLLGRVVLDGRARDLRTDATGAGVVLGEARLSAEVDFVGGRTVTAIASDPNEPRLSALVGVRASSGFRGEVTQAVPDQREAATLVHMLLDDVPVATLVGGYALQAGGVRFEPRQVARMATPDLCSGWVSRGTIMAGIDSVGVVPMVTGPVAPSLLDPLDPIGWHERPALPPHSVRRARRLDLWRDRDRLLLDSLFRDSHVDADGLETVVHEYTVRATVDPSGWTLLEVSAEPRVLPWVECPGAAQSAGRLVGSDLRGLRDEVRRDFVGVGTCTHLNDQLRELADAPALLAALDRTG